jgi:hypothetical protein
MWVTIGMSVSTAMTQGTNEMGLGMTPLVATHLPLGVVGPGSSIPSVPDPPTPALSAQARYRSRGLSEDAALLACIRLHRHSCPMAVASYSTLAYRCTATL